MSLLRYLWYQFSFFYRLMLGKIIGVSYIVNYLRNPNPVLNTKLLRAFGATVGERTVVKRSIYLDNVYEDVDSANNFSHLVIGSNCYIGDCTYVDLAGKVVVGDNVVISGSVSLVTHADCNRSKVLNEVFPRQSEGIIIRDGSWIGFGATILNGVTIGENSAIGAASLMRGDAESFSLYAGIPAVKIRSIHCKNDEA
jgi:acetyltransferase-like isoleucine patch superfamily enzyme